MNDAKLSFSTPDSPSKQAHTQANMAIAMLTRRDSSQMKSIALLTMIFLPATFMAVCDFFISLFFLL